MRPPPATGFAFAFGLPPPPARGFDWVGGSVGLEGCTQCRAWPWAYIHRPSISLHHAGTEHIGFSPRRQTLFAPSAKRSVRCWASRMRGGLHLIHTTNRLRGGLAMGGGGRGGVYSFAAYISHLIILHHPPLSRRSAVMETPPTFGRSLHLGGGGLVGLVWFRPILECFGLESSGMVRKWKTERTESGVCGEVLNRWHD